MGFLVSQHSQEGAIPPPPFLSVSPLGEHAKWGCDTPPLKKGYLSDTRAIPYENKANGCDTPLCDTISKGYCARYGGGISHWAAKVEERQLELDKQNVGLFDSHQNQGVLCHLKITTDRNLPWGRFISLQRQLRGNVGTKSRLNSN